MGSLARFHLGVENSNRGRPHSEVESLECVTSYFTVAAEGSANPW